MKGKCSAVILMRNPFARCLLLSKAILLKTVILSARFERQLPRVPSLWMIALVRLFK